jgi:ankyrin repeat protein
MKLKFCLLAIMLALATLARGETNDLTGLLQKGLFEEEANRDLNAAIANYQSLASAFDKDRQLAATAVFRLGECYRKLGKTNEAATEYQRILKDFSDQQTLVTLSRQNLAALNMAPAPAKPGGNEPSLLDAEANVAAFQTQIREIEKLPVDEARVYVQQNFPNSVLTESMTQLVTAERDLIKIKTDYTPEHPKYKNAQELVDDLNRKIDAQVTGVIEGLKTKLAVAQSLVELLRNQPGGQTATTHGDPVLRAQIEQVQEQLSNDDKQLKELLKTFTAENPRVVELRKRIESQKTALVELNERLQASRTPASSSGNPMTDEEQQEIKRIQAMIQNSPDLINAPGWGGNANMSFTPLVDAATKGELVVAKYLLDHGANVNGGPRMPGLVPLLAAAENGQKAMVELLLSRGADVNGGGLSPLYVAVNRGYVAVAEVLLANKADVNMPSGTDGNKDRPLHRAVWNGRTNLIQLLIDHGADVNVTNWLGDTPLDFAAQQNDTNAAKLLLAAKASVDARDNSGDTALLEAADRGNTTMVSLLLDSGATVDATNGNHTTPLLQAVVRKRTDAIRLLLEHKADPNRGGSATDSNGSKQYGTPVFLAIDTGANDILKLLLDAGGSAEKNAPIFSAIEKNNAEAVRLLLDHGADPNHADQNGNSPLIKVLASGKDKRMVPLLLDKGADANAKDNNGRPALTLTVDPEVGRWLVDHGADVNRRYSSNQLTPLMNVRDTNYVRFLLEAGAKIDLQDTNGNTALHLAMISSSPVLIAVLLEHKANPNIQNDLGFTPLDIAKTGESGNIYGVFQIGGGAYSVNADAERKIAELLMQAGGLFNLPKRNRIEVRRASTFGVPFTKGSHDWNRYSLLEIIAGEYHLLTQNVAGEWAHTGAMRQLQWEHDLRFPDFKNVVIYRRTDASAKQSAINVNVEDILNSGDCSQDMWLEWGDVVEIPEADHPVDQRWPGLSNQTLTVLTNCLARQATVIVKGVSTQLKLLPEVEVTSTSLAGDGLDVTYTSFMLRSVLDNSKLVRVSSDLSRVKVTRIDPETKKKQEWTIDCTNPSQADLWLRNGDVIDVPEK